MKTVQILEAADIIEPTDWCRPLRLVSMNGGHSDYYSFESQYTGQPENNVLWVQVSEILGECWHWKTVGEVHEALHTPYEFMRGEVPKAHEYGLTNKQKNKIKEKALEETITFGKYKGKYTFKKIKEIDHLYYLWLDSEDLFP